MKQVNEKHARIKVRRVSRRGNFCGAIISLSRLVQNCVFLISNFLRPYAQVCAFVFIFGLFLCFWRAYLALSLAYALWMRSSVYIAFRIYNKNVFYFTIFGFWLCVLLRETRRVVEVRWDGVKWWEKSVDAAGLFKLWNRMPKRKRETHWVVWVLRSSLFLRRHIERRNFIWIMARHGRTRQR